MKNLEIRIIDPKEMPEESSTVIVIDVIRAFTVAAYAFAGGAKRLWLVRTVQEAFALREQETKALLAGEVGGHLIPGFDFNNSPSLMAASDVRGRLIIQRTGAGTQGAVKSADAKHLLICSLVNARATSLSVRRLLEASTSLELVTLLPTSSPDGTIALSEDKVCADYLEALLKEREDAGEVVNGGIGRLRTLNRFAFLQAGDPDMPSEDIAAILDVDRFSFAMVGKRKRYGEITYVEVEKVDVNSSGCTCLSFIHAHPCSFVK